MLFFCFIFAIALGAFIAWSIVKSYKNQMTNVVTPGQANEYMVRSSFQVHSEHDKFLYSDLQKIPRDVDHNRGGGHGGGPGVHGGPRGGGPHGGGPRGGGRR